MDQRLLQPLDAITEGRTVSLNAVDPAGSRIFDFESDLERSLVCIPMAVRFKLDKCGIKLSLDQWQQLSKRDRQDLLRTPCEGDAENLNFRRALQALIRATSSDEPRSLDVGAGRLWDEPDVPGQVTRKALELGAVPPTRYQWRALTPLQRFALIKLSRDGDHGRNLIPALREFALL